MSSASAEPDVRPALHEATARGLRAEQKELPTVWLYDEEGSLLYVGITRLPEYYPPRREIEILGVRSDEIARLTGARTLIELGAGTAKNIRLILDGLAAAGTLERFVPFDVSAETVRENAETIAEAYPGVAAQAIVGDFERDLDTLPPGGRRLVAFLGSTIGNLYPERRAHLLSTLAANLGEDDALLLGIDLVKDVARLEAAYNDSQGVTEAFVRNALDAVDRELDATFDQRRFAFSATWDPEREWMSIGFRAREAHTVSVGRLGLDVAFERDEYLRVEISAKFRRASFEDEAARAGLEIEAWWTDAAGDFAVVLLVPEPAGRA